MEPLIPQFLAQELNSHFLCSYIMHLYKSKHRKPQIVYTHLRELHNNGLSSHYVPTSRAIPQLEAWLKISCPKLLAKLIRMIEINEMYPATIIQHIKPVWSNGVFSVTYNQIAMKIPTPASLIRSVHSYIDNSTHLTILQFICALRADMSSPGHHVLAANPTYYSMKGQFFSQHRDLVALLDNYRINHLIELSFGPTEDDAKNKNRAAN